MMEMVSWKNILPWLLLSLMALIAISLTVFVGIKAFRGKK